MKPKQLSAISRPLPVGTSSIIQDPLICLLRMETSSLQIYRRLQNADFLSSRARAVFKILAREKQLRANRLLQAANLDELREIMIHELPPCSDQLFCDTKAIVDALNQQDIVDLEALSLVKSLELAHWNFYLNSGLAYNNGEMKELISDLIQEAQPLIRLLSDYILEQT